MLSVCSGVPETCSTTLPFTVDFAFFWSVPDSITLTPSTTRDEFPGTLEGAAAALDIIRDVLGED